LDFIGAIAQEAEKTTRSEQKAILPKSLKPDCILEKPCLDWQAGAGRLDTRGGTIILIRTPWMFI
jgi:hypothetical protein